MKNKKGFTLVELLAVIIIISIIALIVFPVVTKQIKGSKDDLYKVQVENIIKAAKDYILDNPELLDEYHINPTLVSIEDLQTATNSKGITYLEEGSIKSPLDGNAMNGTVVVAYDEDSQQYTYDYQEVAKSVLQSTISTSAATTIISKNNILTNESESGLFEDVSTSRYVFKGATPKNYIKVGSNLWRIVSIDKDTHAMKIAKISHQTKVMWHDGSVSVSSYTFNNTSLKISTYLNSDYYNTLSDGLKSLIEENSKWYAGEVLGPNIVSGVDYTKSVKDMRSSEESTLSINSNVGLLTVSEFAEATYDLDCRKNYGLAKCGLNNYLVLNKDYWLANKVTNANKIWAVTDQNSGGIMKTDISSELTVIPTVVLKASATISGGSGAIEDPYLLVIPE